MTKTTTTYNVSHRIFFFVIVAIAIGLLVLVNPVKAFQSIRYHDVAGFNDKFGYGGVAAGGHGRSNCCGTNLQANNKGTTGTTTTSTSTIATLTEETTWNMRMVLQNLPTMNGKTTNQIFAIRVRFIEEVDYEPPQGYLFQVMDGDDQTNNNNDNDGDATAVVGQPQMRIVSSRWQLSEDPNDRKDSLWIWGLFKDPLYPFLLLQMEIDSIPIPGEGMDSIKPFKLFAQINHKREGGQVILSSGADLTIKEKETIKADPFGAATVDVYEDVAVGKLQIQAMK